MVLHLQYDAMGLGFEPSYKEVISIGPFLGVPCSLGGGLAQCRGWSWELAVEGFRGFEYLFGLVLQHGLRLQDCEGLGVLRV